MINAGIKILWTCCDQEVNVSTYITLLHLTRSAIWQTQGWHGAQRSMDENRCHPSHTVPPQWARQGRHVKRKSSQKGQTTAWFQLDGDGWLYFDMWYRDARLSSIWYVWLYLSASHHEHALRLAHRVKRRFLRALLEVLHSKATSKPRFSTVWEEGMV